MRGRVAVVGAGNMGSAAAERLASQGFEVILWNRTREKAEAVASKIGAKVAGSVEDAVGSAEYVVSFLSDDDAVVEVASRIPRSDGLVYLEMSTITPKAARLLASHVESKGACFLHSPVLGGPGRVREGKLIILSAGKQRCRSLAQPVFEALSEHVVYLGEDPAMAAAAKLAFNNLLVTAVGAAAESTVLAEAYGVEPQTFLDILLKTVFADFADTYLRRMLASERKTHFAMRLAAKDVSYAAWSLREAGIPAFIASAAAQAFTAASALGYAEDDYTRIRDVLRMMAHSGKGCGQA
ncbi:MAG: NAD(P)-dependent oxidoreductase [Thermoproteota archaeon]